MYESLFHNESYFSCQYMQNVKYKVEQYDKNVLFYQYLQLTLLCFSFDPDIYQNKEKIQFG